MRMKSVVTALCGALLIAALPMTAHHSFSAEYDQSKPLNLKGKFVKMDWVNPHSWVHFEVTNADGTKTLWKAETPPPNGLYRLGWRKDSIKPGENIEITGSPAKDGTTHMWAGSVKLLDTGATLGFGQRPPGQGPEDAKGKAK